MIVHNVEQRSPEWHELRRGRVTASNFGTMMGKSQKRTDDINKLAVATITGVIPENFTTPAMERGTRLEPEAIDAYSWVTGNAVTEVGFITLPLFPLCGDSPDGLVGDDGVVEVKCPGEPQYCRAGNAIDKGRLPAEYRWQVYGHLLFTDRDWCDLIIYFPGLPLLVHREYPDQLVIKELADGLGRAEHDLFEAINTIRNRG